MTTHQTFGDKWRSISGKKKDEELSIFVEKGEKPRTQRQFNLFNYWEFIHNVIEGRGYRNAIEIGCGRGTISLYLNLYEGLDLVCSDSETEAIKLAKINFERFGAKANFLVSDAASLALPDNSVDVSVSIGLLEHLESYHQVLSEQLRILKPGGVMISLNIPKKHSIQDLNKLYRMTYKLFKPSYALKPDYFRNTDDPATYATNATKIGFQDVYTINVNPFPLFTPINANCERLLTIFYRFILSIRRLYLRYPFKTVYGLSQAHFLVGFKK